MTFSELNLVEGLRQGIDEAGFVDCTAVQELTFKETFQGRDVLVQSQTGTGKTAAFLITIFQLFSTQPERTRKALVIVPTRELAVQVEDEANLLGGHLSFRIGSIYGGVGYNKQERLIADGVDLLVGTPGRLLDLAQSGKLKFGIFDTLVIDEADRMFDMGFYPDVRQILSGMPDRMSRLTMLFSATLSTRVRNLAWDHMNSPAEIEIEPEHVTVEEITQELYHVTGVDKVSLLLGVMKKEQPRNALIFANTKYTVVELAKRLSYNGYPTEFIMGDLPQRQRLSLISGIKSGSIKFLVATDVAARGLHIEGLDLVVNYDLPEDFEVYVHRIGRTARAGKTGKAISFACERYVYGLPAIESFIGMKIPVSWASDEMYEEDKSAAIDFRREIRIREEREGRGSRRPGGRGREEGREREPHRGRQGAGAGPARYPGPTRPPEDRPQPAGNRHRPSRPDAAPSERRPPAGREVPQGRPTEARSPQGRPPQGRPPREGSVPGARPPSNGGAPGARPSSDAPLEERLSYYQSKYGDDFRAGRSRSGDSGGRQRPPERGQGAERSQGGERSGGSKGRGRTPAGTRQRPEGGQGGPRDVRGPAAGSKGQGRGPAGGPKGQGKSPTPSSKSYPKSSPKSTPSPAKNQPGGTLFDRIKGLFRRK